MSRADLARATGMHPNAITRALNNTGGRGGNVPPVWLAILEALDLRLTVEPGAAPPENAEEGKSAPSAAPALAEAPEGSQ